MKIFVSKNVTSLSKLQMDIVVFDFETLLKLVLSVGFGGSPAMLRSTEFYFNSGSWGHLKATRCPMQPGKEHH